MTVTVAVIIPNVFFGRPSPVWNKSVSERKPVKLKVVLVVHAV